MNHTIILTARMLLLIIAFILALTGHAGLSILLDGVVAVSWLLQFLITMLKKESEEEEWTTLSLSEKYMKLKNEFPINEIDSDVKWTLVYGTVNKSDILKSHRNYLNYKMEGLSKLTYNEALEQLETELAPK